MLENQDTVFAGQPPTRRRGQERRITTLASVVWGGASGRRRRARRCDEQVGYYIDWYESPLFLVCIGIFLLSCTDAVLTLRLLQQGAVELNPIMRLLLDMHVRAFAIVKVATTGICLLVMIAHIRFRIFGLFKVEHLLHLVLWLYGALIAHESILLVQR